jgi:hypothetical protein
MFIICFSTHCLYNMDTRDGIIITTHIPRNDNAAPDQSCPGIHIIDIVQPPGIGMPPMVDMETPQMIVTAVLAAKSRPLQQRRFGGKFAQKPYVNTRRYGETRYR